MGEARGALSDRAREDRRPCLEDLDVKTEVVIDASRDIESRCNLAEHASVARNVYRGCENILKRELSNDSRLVPNQHGRSTLRQRQHGRTNCR